MRLWELGYRGLGVIWGAPALATHSHPPKPPSGYLVRTPTLLANAYGALGLETNWRGVGVGVPKYLPLILENRGKQRERN